MKPKTTKKTSQKTTGKRKAAKPHNVKPSTVLYDTACGPGLRSWRLWGIRRSDRALVEVGRNAAFGPLQALKLATFAGEIIAKILGKHYFDGFTVEDLNQNESK
jgi:hypothetical protein